jgi:mRNA interferase MazF
MKRFDVYLVSLDPTVGSEMKRSRPAVIVSPDEVNEHLGTVIIVPLTTGRSFPFRPATRFRGTPGIAAIDQIRAVDRRRLTRRLGALDAQTSAVLLKALGELFAP